MAIRAAANSFFFVGGGGENMTEVFFGGEIEN